MNYERRKLLKNAASLGIGIALSPLLIEESKKIRRFGIQLYSVRDVLPADPKNVLRQLASFGYKHIESYEGPNGMFWGMGHTGFKKYMDDLGMTIIASHCDVKKDFRKKIDEAAAIGMKYLICPWLGAQKSIDDFKRFADQFNEYGRQCKEAGIRFAYHNHDYSFKTLNGEMPQEVLMKGTDPALVDYEMDIYWVVTAGQDPIQWLKKHPTRFKAFHIKDRSKNPGPENGKNSVDLGTGSIDFGKILKGVVKEKMQYYFVEQEFYPNGSSIEAARTNAEFMKRIKL